MLSSREAGSLALIYFAEPAGCKRERRCAHEKSSRQVVRLGDFLGFFLFEIVFD